MGHPRRLHRRAGHHRHAQRLRVESIDALDRHPALGAIARPGLIGDYCRLAARSLLVQGDDLRADQQPRGGDLETQQQRNGCGKGAVQHADLRQGGKEPRQQVPRQFPQQARSDTTDQRMPPRQVAGRHHHVDRAQQHDLAGQPGRVEQRAGRALQRTDVAKHVDLPRTQRLQRAGSQRHQQQADADDQDVGVRQQRRSDPVAAVRLDAVMKDGRQRFLEHRESQRTGIFEITNLRRARAFRLTPRVHEVREP